MPLSKILLTEEEILELSCEEACAYGCCKDTARAQLKKVVEWGNEPCPHTYNPNYFKPQRLCNECWQSLLDEVKEAKHGCQ